MKAPPDVIVADATLISMSMPYIFKPQHVYYNINGERLVDTKRHVWVDGGLFENYPLCTFDDPRYLSEKSKQDMQLPFYNPETLGLKLVSKEYKDYFEGRSAVPENNVSNLLAFTGSLLNGIFSKQEDEYDIEPNRIRSIHIDNLGISTYDLALTRSQQQALIISGKHATRTYFKQPTDDLAPLQVEEEKQEEVIPEGLTERCVLQ
jgi:NTE family protein